MSSFVLVLEPHAESRDALAELLAECGAELRFAATVGEAERIVEADAPCVVLCACGPNDVSPVRGLATLLRLKEQSVDVRLIVLSTVSGLKPFDDRTTILPKPFKPAALVELVCASAVRCRAGA